MSDRMPLGLYVGLWKRSEYSDVRIRLAAQTPSSDSHHTDESAAADGTDRPETACDTDGQRSKSNGSSTTVYQEFPAHTLVLKDGSRYFEGKFTTGTAFAGQPEAEGAVKRSGVGESTPVIELTCDSQEDADANEAVIEFLYKNTLPASPTVSMLCKMIVVADYLLAELCFKTCAHELCKQPIDQQSIPVVWELMDKLRHCSSMDPALSEKIQTALSDCVVDTYGDVPSVIEVDNLLTSFCKLPLDTVKVWGSSDKLKVDSENSVVVLLNKWWHSQPVEFQTEECKAQLSALVRPAFVSTGYLQYALDKLDWYIAPFPEYKFACSIVSLVGISQVYKATKPFNTLNLAKRLTTSRTQLQLVMRCSRNEIQQAVATGTGWSIQGPSGYWQGHMWSLQLKNNSKSSGSGISFGVAKQAADMMPKGIPEIATITIDEKPCKSVWQNLMFHNGQGCLGAWYCNKTFTETEVIDALQQYLTDDNHLVLTVTISNVK